MAANKFLPAGQVPSISPDDDVVRSYKKLSEKLLAGYEEHLRTRGLSEHTVRSYLSSVAEYLAFLTAGNPLERPHAAVPLYVGNLLTRGVSTLAVDHHLSVLRSFFKHLHRDGLIPQNPMIALESRRRTPRPLPKVLTQNEMDLLVTSTTEPRDRALLEFFYATGCRVGELVAARVEDVNWYGHCLVLRGKGRKERVAIFNRQAAISLRAYLGNRTNGPLFPQKRCPDVPISSRSILRIVAAFSLRAGFAGIHPHSFRHAFATHLLDRGMNLRFIQELLGHESIVTTQFYTRVSVQQLIETVRKCHPRG